jgi:hypothetical protein
MPGRPPRHSTDSGPLDPVDLLPDDALEQLEQMALLDGGAPPDAGEPAWRPPLAVPYAAPDALRDGAGGASDPDLPYWLAFNRLTLRRGHKSRRCSVQSRRLPCESPKGLPGPLNIERGVHIAVQD